MFAAKTMSRWWASLAQWRAGEARKDSDIDLIVRFSKRKSLLFMVRLERELAEALGRKVDLLIETSISPYMRERVLKEMQVIYGSR